MPKDMITTTTIGPVITSSPTIGSDNPFGRWMDATPPASKATSDASTAWLCTAAPRLTEAATAANGSRERRKIQQISCIALFTTQNPTTLEWCANHGSPSGVVCVPQNRSILALRGCGTLALVELAADAS